ncbi:ATP/GTP-binding protein [Coniochaeta sp. 2T2.1]|nr:ATP/GTP-binding protein [Coniochaeta sp. 2T2.1]
MAAAGQIIPEEVKSRLLRTEQDPRPVVVMTCGIAGSGKSTLSKAIAASYPSFTRISIDQIIASRHGLYGVDYPPSAHAAFELEADEIYDATFRQLLKEGKDIMLDRSHYAKADRDAVLAEVEEAGARRVLVYFKAERNVLWRRICERKAKGASTDGDGALEISKQLLDRYVEGFDVPDGEGEIVIELK